MDPSSPILSTCLVAHECGKGPGYCRAKNNPGKRKSTKGGWLVEAEAGRTKGSITSCNLYWDKVIEGKHALGVQIVEVGSQELQARLARPSWKLEPAGRGYVIEHVGGSQESPRLLMLASFFQLGGLRAFPPIKFKNHPSRSAAEPRTTTRYLADRQLEAGQDSSLVESEGETLFPIRLTPCTASSETLVP